jgi:putative peptidoglycan lipid II flippase
LAEGTEGTPRGVRAARVGVVALILAGSVGLSRVLGFVREAVIAAQIGAGSEVDAYRAAFLLPDLLNHFLAGGALSIAFIPFFSRVRAQEGAEAADSLFGVVLGTLGCAVVLATAALWWQAEALIALQFGGATGFDADTQALATRLTRILLPAQIFFVTGGVIRAVLMANDRFTSQALAPLVYNLGIIIGGALAGRSYGAEGFAWGALVGAFLGPFAIPVVELSKAGLVQLRLRVAPFDARFLAYVWLALPLMFGVSLLTLDEWYERWFGARLGEGVIAYLGFARMLALVPVGVIGQAIATAGLPTLARLVSEERREELDALVTGMLRSGLALALVAAGAVWVVAEPAVELLYQRGRFEAADSVVVASLLRILALAIPAWVLQQIAVRPFYARNDMWRPMLLGTAVGLAVAPLYWVLGHRSGAEGLALAGVLGMTLSAAATLVLARRLHGAPKLSALASSGARALLAVAPAVLAAVWLPIRDFEGAPGAALELALRGGVFGLVALAGILVFADDATRTAVNRVLLRLRVRRK